MTPDELRKNVTLEEYLHWNPRPIGPDPPGPWIRFVDILDKEGQLEIALHLLDFNKTVIETQKTILDAQQKAITNITNIMAAAKTHAASAAR